MRPALGMLFILLLFASQAFAQARFRLAGDWKGEIVSTHGLQEGLAQGESCLFSIKEEHDGVFFGYRIYHNDAGRQSWEFSGVFNPRTRNIHITEADGNLFLGSVIAPNEIELHQLQTRGAPGAARYILHRAD